MNRKWKRKRRERGWAERISVEEGSRKQQQEAGRVNPLLPSAAVADR
jgi:hypothetical protein